jgi:proliferating cell nuclear antigen
MPVALIEENDITLAPDGMKVRSIDAAHVAMVNMELSKSMFEEYECTAKRKIRLCIESKDNYGNGSSLIGQWPSKTKGSTVIMQLRDETEWEKARLELTFISKLRKQAKIPLFKPSDEEPPIPRIPFNARVLIILADLLEVFRDLEKHTSNFWVTATQENFKIEAVTELTEEFYLFEKGSDSMLELIVREPSKATYNLNYVLPILKQLKTAFKLVTLEWSLNMPLKITGGNRLDGATVEYYLAPQVTSVDEVTDANYAHASPSRPKPIVISEDKVTVPCITSN